MNRNEIIQAVKDDIKKEAGVWSRMDTGEKELVAIIAMIAIIGAALACWLVF